MFHPGGQKGLTTAVTYRRSFETTRTNVATTMDADLRSRINASLSSRGAGYAAPTPDGRYLLVRAGSEGTVVDPTTGEDIAGFPADGNLPPTPSPDGAFFATVDGGTVQVRSLPDADLVHAFGVPDGRDVSIRGSGRNLLAPGGDVLYLHGPPWPPGDWTRFRTATGEAERSYPGVGVGDPWGADVWVFAASADGDTVAVTGATGPVGGGFVTVYDAASGEVEADWPLAGEGDGVALSSDGSMVVSISEGSVLHGDRWSDTGPDSSWTDSGTDGRIVDIEFVRDGHRVLVATDEGRLALRDAETGEITAAYEVGVEARWMRTTEDATLVVLGGHPPRLVTPDW